MNTQVCTLFLSLFFFSLSVHSKRMASQHITQCPNVTLLVTLCTKWRVLTVLKFELGYSMLNSQECVAMMLGNTCHVRFDIVFSHSKCILAQSEVVGVVFSTIPVYIVFM